MQAAGKGAAWLAAAAGTVAECTGAAVARGAPAPAQVQVRLRAVLRLAGRLVRVGRGLQ